MKHPPRIDWYAPSHPFYYKRGGTIRFPKQIRAEATASTIKPYRFEEIEKTASLPEPKRSAKLAKLKQEVLTEIKSDLSRYLCAATSANFDFVVNDFLDEVC